MADNNENQPNRSLKEITESISLLVKQGKPMKFEEDLNYTLPPFVSKPQWTELGDALRIAEKYSTGNVPGNKFISLRLDGHGFSKMVQRLRKAEAFCSGYSPDFGRIMQECCVSLMDQFSCSFGYTQSDEITVVIPATRVIRGEQQPHAFNGRVLKLCTLAASTVATLFNYRVAELTELSPSLLARFDCRLGIYDTFEEALSLVLWRAYDCGINGIADACHHQRGKIEGAKQAVGKSNREKLLFLHKHNLLPLADHQAYGSFYVRVKRVRELEDPRTNEKVVRLRGVVEKVDGGVLNLFQEGKLILKDEVLEEDEEIKE
uniref:tRNAHis guanylyltransferase catalytic domain-containing protein n=1 Tax=Paramoeba aestuarina TaxID=180227 RepID=A0A7S4KI77_9EUKA|mmetsp:Transcript_19736/g.30873  ORF Transcript_19736/g.30873 Transcript_19736/m.30873 type:complete len:319 (+) Transcript_19736:131-1087(+)|eukprot:CAMPEP_0201529334 /NCGR_PEP_ID=MMETSP0161_2-20130828/41347_1 /ASSEMBLY_ACC=CAM_ASM_000251 /TAXON_ID=180227 /ORGANISM="Neoparamoeba aestuarina, Strain SoJaBio B1-5/56/2" /LENGTH=318 /DNA_ID=CAMNT_0047931087 /DNA_START=120 /DNA_END=1076 /DNA_ORIENTATION=+